MTYSGGLETCRSDSRRRGNGVTVDEAVDKVRVKLDVEISGKIAPRY